jgi:hypothetical protein
MINKPPHLLPYEVAELSHRRPRWLRAAVYLLEAASVFGFTAILLTVAAYLEAYR